MSRLRRTALNALGPLALLALGGGLAGCDSKKKDETKFVVKGRVDANDAIFLHGVTLVARCGTTEVRTSASDSGDYEIEVPRTGCDRVVFTWEKESFASAVRTLRLPTSRDSITLNVRMATLVELICGLTRCSPEEEAEGGSTAPANPIARGWVGGFDGRGGSAVPGEYFDLEGRPLVLTTIAVADYRDVTGKRIDALPMPITLCSLVKDEKLDELQDLTPTGPTGTIDMSTYALDPTTGRWRVSGQAVVAAGGLDDFGNLRIQEYAEDLLGDIRRKALPVIKIEEPPLEEGGVATVITLAQVYLCAPFPGSGMMAYGTAQAAKSCVNVSVIDPCGVPDPEATVEMFGRDRSFYNWGPTNEEGAVCLEGQRSEVLSESQSANGVQGETFWMDLTITPKEYETTKTEAIAMPTKDGDCSRPETCTEVAVVIEKKGVMCDNADASTDETSTGVDGGNPEGKIVIRGK